MEETDVGRLLAAAAPETVPPISGLPERARALGRRRRLRRTVMTGGGAGIALASVVGVVAALGGFGSGQPDRGSSFHVAGPGATSPTPTKTSTTPPSTPAPAKPKSTLGGHATDDPVADGKLTDAVRAALPAEDRDGLKLYRAAGSTDGYGAEFDWGPRSQQSVFSVSAAVYTPEPKGDTPTMCAADHAHCTTGTAPLHGHQVRWEYYYGDLSSPSLNIYDNEAGVGYLITANGPNAAHLPGLAEMKDVGLNEQVATALLAAWPR